MSETPGQVIVGTLSSVRKLDPKALAQILCLSKDARRQVLGDLAKSDDPLDNELFQAVLELATLRGDIEGLSFRLAPSSPKLASSLSKEQYQATSDDEEDYEDDAEISELIQDLYRREEY